MNNRFKKGFTLVELSLIVLLIGILIAFIIPTLAGTESSSRLTAIATVKNYITEYKTNNSTDYENDLVIMNITDSEMFIFGYSFDEDVLYIFAEAPWLMEAQIKAKDNLKSVAEQITLSAEQEVVIPVGNADETDPYPYAHGLYEKKGTELLILSDPDIEDNTAFPEKSIKKMKNNTLFLAGKMNTKMSDPERYICNVGGIEYTVAFAEPDELSGSDVADNTTYKTVFKLNGGEISGSGSNITFTTEGSDIHFICPDDPIKSGEYFVYWKLVNVNGTSKDIPATALVPGEKYEIPNSDVVYEAYYVDSATPSENDDNYYEIYNVDQLNWLGSHTDKNAILMRSFVASGVNPIGTSTNRYTGRFDGNNHKLINLNLNGSGIQALFKYTENAEIKNLTLKSPKVRGDKYVSAIVSQAIGGSITNCKVTGAEIVCNDITESTSDPTNYIYIETVDNTDPLNPIINAEGGTYCGGIVAFAKSVTISGCTVSGKVDGGNSGSAIGGIVGAVCGESSISKCSNTSTVTGVRYVGGVVGKTQTTATPEGIINSITVSESYNNGKVTRSDTTLLSVITIENTDPKYVTEAGYCVAYGGIIGGTTADTKLEESYNAKDGKVESDKQAVYAGALVGLAHGGKLNIDKGTNYGEVKFKMSVGGILGADIKSELVINNSENCGNVTATSNNAGGILGYAKTVKTKSGATDASISILNCSTSNLSDVKAGICAGGIIGLNERTIKAVKNCSNGGKVTETVTISAGEDIKVATGCGGITGYTIGKMNVQNCQNSGTIKSGCQGVGGIIGKAASTTITVTATAAPGETETPSPTTAIISSKYTNIIGCSNKGTIVNAPAEPTEVPTAPAESAEPTPTPTSPYTYAGGILGYSNEIVSVDYCYNAGYIKGEKNVGGLVGAMVESTPDATIEPTPTPDSTTEPTPTPTLAPGETPVPTVSLIKHSYNVGLVEATSQTEAIAGAIIGTDEWGIETTDNFYLKNCVKPTTVTVITKPTTEGAQDYGTEKAHGEFIKEDETGVMALLNNERVEQALTPMFEKPTVSGGDTEPEFKYLKALINAVSAYNEVDENKITLPKWLPLIVAS